MIRNLIFDLGGVILNYDVEADTRALAQAGLPEYSSWDRYPELGKVANLYLNGLISDAEFCTRIDPFCAAGTTDSMKLYSMQAVLADIPRERLEAIRALRGRYRIFLLSNINHLSWEYALEQFAKAGIDPSDCFDRLFLSYELGIAKPDWRIFHHVLETTGSLAEETLFLDDSSDNIRAAQELGIQTYKVPMNSPEGILRELADDSLTTN